jgi:conjugal transfer/type IV secretion protein DotA/TraY
LSLIFLSQVFGDLNGFWGITDPDATFGASSSIHTAVHEMLSLYSMAMMVIAVIIVIYYIMTVVGEAAKTGTPFGQRFNSLWAPIRLVIALGLLVPMGSGLNSAQYITLWMAKMGAGLGTQVWTILAGSVNDTSTKKYVVEGFDTDWLPAVAQDIMRYEVCKEAYNKYNRGNASMQFSAVETDISEPELIGYKVEWKATDPTNTYPNHRQNCGTIEVTFPAPDTSGGPAIENIVPTDVLLEAIKIVINELRDDIEPLAAEYADYTIPENGGRGPQVDIVTLTDDVTALGAVKATAALNSIASTLYGSHRDLQIQAMLEDHKEQGWIAAGMWYMNIGRVIQGSEQTQEHSVPISGMPETRIEDRNPETWGEWFFGSGYESVDSSVWDLDAHLRRKNITEFLRTAGYYTLYATLFINPVTQPAAIAYTVGSAAYNYFTTPSAEESACAVLGLEAAGFNKIKCAIYTMIVPENLVLLASSDHSTLDPMASLITAGSTIIDRAWKMVIAGMAADLIGGMASALPIIGGLLDGAGSLMVMLGLLGLAAGLVLFFLLPLMPFIYFFFAVISWVLEIFEAVIAMPLWALAHLKIDGDGMPGQAAVNGYYLLLAILLRPALIVFGLIGGYMIFGAGVYLLQQIYTPLLSVLRDDAVMGLELLVFTLIFAYLAYMLGMTCFKMVDLVPQQVLRWIGSGAQSFNDQKQDMGGSMQGAVIGAAAVGTQLSNTLSGGAKGMGKGISGKRQQKQSDQDQATALASQRKFDAEQTDKIAGALGSGDKGGGPGSGGTGAGGGLSAAAKASREGKSRPK